MNIKGLKTERKDRKKRGGRVAVYIKGSLNHSRRKDIPLDDLEVVCIETKALKASPFIIIAWYRPPSDPISTFEKFEKVLQFLENENKETILIGNTNCNSLNKVTIQSLRGSCFPSHDLTVTPDAQSGRGVNRQIIDLYDTCGLKQLIKVPTRETIQTSTLIDHIVNQEILLTLVR